MRRNSQPQSRKGQVMTKAIFGIAAALALATTTARADEDVKAVENVSSDSAATEVDAPEGSKVAARTESMSRTVRATPADTGSREVKPADRRERQADDWLITREGYRDGGY
jgi:hypothetical protein